MNCENVKIIQSVVFCRDLPTGRLKIDSLDLGLEESFESLRILGIGCFDNGVQSWQHFINVPTSLESAKFHPVPKRYKFN